MSEQCPYCQDSQHQIKAGKNKSGSQKYKCKLCDRRYTPQPSQMYSDEMRLQAVKLYADGMNYRRIGRQLGVDHKTVINWVKAYTDQLPDAPQPEQVDWAELDELFTFVGARKRDLRDDGC